MYNAPNIKKSKKTEQGDRLYRKNGNEIMQAMIDDKGYIYCEHCNRPNALGYERHHIIWKSEKPGHENLHDKENLLILCKDFNGSCHDKWHADKSLRNKLVEERELDKLFGKDILNK